MGVLMSNPNMCIQKVSERLGKKSAFAQFENKDIFHTNVMLQ